MLQLKDIKQTLLFCVFLFHLTVSKIFILFVFYQVAVMSGHFELGEIIKNHRDTDVGK